MIHDITIRVPEELYLALSSQAARRGEPLPVHVNHLLTEAVQQQSLHDAASEKSPSRRKFSDFFGIVTDGDYGDANNEKIDEDLAKEYGSTHE